VLQDLRVAQQHWFLLTTLQLLRCLPHTGGT